MFCKCELQSNASFRSRLMILSQQEIFVLAKCSNVNHHRAKLAHIFPVFYQLSWYVKKKVSVTTTGNSCKNYGKVDGQCCYTPAFISCITPDL
jgi:hypothetical protein